MTTTVIDTNTTGADLIYTLNPGDSFILTTGTNLVGTSSNGFTSSYIYGPNGGNNVIIDGYMNFNGTSDSPFYFSGHDIINIGPTGRLVLSGSQSYGTITLGGGGTLFNNEGSIVINRGYGIYVGGGNDQIINSGSIVLHSGALNMARYFAGDALFNSGAITSTTDFAVELGDFGASIDNTGTIESHKVGGTAIVMGLVENKHIFNAGLIHSASGGAVLASSDAYTGGLVLINTGTISAGTTAVFSAAGADLLRNSGHIVGNVLLGGGDDRFYGIGGQVDGTVDLGVGNDIYRISDAAIDLFEATLGGTDRVDSTVGFTLGANFENLTLLGVATLGVGNGLDNSLQGNGADNVLRGLAGNDTLNGASGDDRLVDGQGNDLLNGGDGDDTLTGGLGNDTLRGGNDDDRLLGGDGRDNMAGGTGSDSFVYWALADTGNTSLTGDIITDFEVGLDVLDLSHLDANTTNALPNDAFTFIGAAAFGGVAGQVRVLTTGGTTRVLLDVNGDSLSDAQITLTNAALLQAQDFIL